MIFIKTKLYSPACDFPTFNFGLLHVAANSIGLHAFISIRFVTESYNKPIIAVFYGLKKILLVRKLSHRINIKTAIIV